MKEVAYFLLLVHTKHYYPIFSYQWQSVEVFAMPPPRWQPSGAKERRVLSDAGGPLFSEDVPQVYCLLQLPQ